MSNGKWIPEIMYEESDEEGVSSNIPFVMVPVNESMPNLLYIFESRDTGQTEPNLEGDEVPVYEWDLHQYADMLQLKNKLDKKVHYNHEHLEQDNIKKALVVNFNQQIQERNRIWVMKN